MVQLHMGPTQSGKEWIIAPGRGQMNVGQTKLVARIHGTNLTPKRVRHNLRAQTNAQHGHRYRIKRSDQRLGVLDPGLV